MTTSNERQLEQEWPKPQQFRKSIRLEFSFYFAGIILILMAATGYIVTNQYVNTVTRNIVEKLLVQARSYSGSSGKLIISTNGPDALLLNNICRNLAADNENIHWVGITDNNNKFLAHTDFKKVVAGMQMMEITSKQFDEILLAQEKFQLKDDTILVSVPIFEKNIVVGKLGVASSNKQVVEARNTSILTMVSITAIMILIGIPIAMFILHRKLRPVSLITNSLKQIDFENIALDIPLVSQNEFGYLSETLKVMGSKLNAAQKDLLERDRIARELEIAREIQAKILPREYPRGVTFEFSGKYSSAREVGGDYYDFIDFGDEYLMFLVDDVSGKSLPGMLVMLLTRDIIRQQTRVVRQPDELLSDVNRELLANIKKGMFVTMFLGLLNKKTGQLTFASAGHNPLIIMKGNTGRSELIKTNGFPLGMMPPEQFNKRIERGQYSLSESDWLIQYTDGINEAHNVDDEEFGMDRFVEALKSQSVMKPDELVNNIIEQHLSFVGNAEQFDDITLLVMKWSGISDDIKRNADREGINAACS